ncbi:hypothetical protein [Massilia rubra]|uniref:Uncharacterized protein n=1 Tax=Massilia rubra TaxID=2607910 RepID=A0ABX0LQ60_9BURK|nr:hypothetical protein [Massilia rubra]NHZ34833.1 hypothetical protein [Massilia rubra]
MPIERKILFAYTVTLVILSICLFAAYVEVRHLSERLGKIETLVHIREEADPLVPPECEFSPHHCTVSFKRLISDPRLFHNRKITVTGIYVLGFEESALYPPGTEIFDSNESAIWISNPEHMKENMSSVTITGVFKRGPSGHLMSYSGELKSINMEVNQPGKR